MEESQKQRILENAKNWWRNEVAVAHRKNTLKLSDLSQFNINPFLWSYLAYFLRGNASSKSLAEVLIYPRILGTSITTSFGTRSQQMITKLFDGITGSTTPGVDIEFVDKVDGRKKFCQIKAGPNVVNGDDVKPIKDHFRGIVNIARTNSVDLQPNDIMFCLIYGELHEKNVFIREIEKDYPVVIGKDFWHRFTGDENFYEELIEAIRSVANEFNMEGEISKLVDDLSEKIEKDYPDLIQ
jgi:hypothetical protein